MKYPNPLRSLAAFIYDLCISFAIVMIATYVLLPFTHGQAIQAGNHWYQTYLLFLLFAYWAGFWYWRGQTIGMLVWKIKVLNSDGGKIKFWQVLVRFIFALIFSAPAWLLCFFTRERRGLYDFAAGTKLILLNKELV